MQQIYEIKKIEIDWKKKNSLKERKKDYKIKTKNRWIKKREIRGIDKNENSKMKKVRKKNFLKSKRK